MSIPMTAHRLGAVDSPLRAARVAAGFSRRGLAQAAGVSYPSLMAAELGSQAPTLETLERLAPLLKADATSLAAAVLEWRELFLERPVNLSRQEEAVIELSPEQIGKAFESFAEWRSHFAGSSRQFALRLGLNHSSVARWELGRLPRGQMPAPLERALLNRLQMTPAQVAAVAALPVGGREEVEA